MAGKERMFAFDSKMFFVIPSFLFLGLEMEKREKTLIFVFGMDMINQDIKKNSMVFVFETFQCRKPNLQMLKTQKTEFFSFLIS